MEEQGSPFPEVSIQSLGFCIGRDLLPTGILPQGAPSHQFRPISSSAQHAGFDESLCLLQLCEEHDDARASSSCSCLCSSSLFGLCVGVWLFWEWLVLVLVVLWLWSGDEQSD